jgi:ATP-dependent DNA helicase RecG
VDLPLGPLRLEASRGYADTAVEGGLGRFMRRWADLAAQRVADEGQRQAVLNLGASFAGYACADAAGRRELVRVAEETIRALMQARRSRERPRLSRPVTLSSPTTALRGVSTKRAELLRRLGIATLADLLQHYPARYEDRRTVVPLASAAPRETVVVAVEVTGPGETIRRGGQHVTRVPVADASGGGLLTWFGQPYRAAQFPPGTKLVCCGVARPIGGVVSLQSPECEVVGDHRGLHMRRIVPIHPATEGLSPTLIRTLVHAAIEATEGEPADIIPETLRAARALMPAAEARRAIHFPSAPKEVTEARRRWVYEEFLLLQALLAIRRRLLRRPAPAAIVPVDEALLADLESALPFALTAAQRRVIGSVADDLRSDRPASRLIHGDVGAGKTVVAAFALAAAARAGRQAAFMAPTELLAEQHDRVLTELLRPLGLRPALLVGSAAERDKARVRAGIASGDVRIVVGTHALIHETTQFTDLGVVVVDEQHRFGVLQRATLTAKGHRPHLFVMTATPIPRTLALVAYGDCDISVLDELPPGRQAPGTRLLSVSQRDRAYQHIRRAAGEGHQAFVVCPLIEESEALQAEAARRRHDELAEGVFRGLRLGLLHGRLRPDIRASLVDAFRRHDLDVLVTTTIIEVGVDIPAATIMAIENAERYGLAQLHQLRGRVGRGVHPGTCYLIAAATRRDPAWERLSALVDTADGFALAQTDLRLRGPGDLSGTRQAGLPALRIADLTGDAATLEEAREDAFALIEHDPALSRAENALLRDALRTLAPTMFPLTSAN